MQLADFTNEYEAFLGTPLQPIEQPINNPIGDMGRDAASTYFLQYFKGASLAHICLTRTKRADLALLGIKNEDEESIGVMGLVTEPTVYESGIISIHWRDRVEGTHDGQVALREDTRVLTYNPNALSQNRYFKRKRKEKEYEREPDRQAVPDIPPSQALEHLESNVLNHLGKIVKISSTYPLESRLSIWTGEEGDGQRNGEIIVRAVKELHLGQFALVRSLVGSWGLHLFKNELRPKSILLESSPGSLRGIFDLRNAVDLEPIAYQEEI